MKKVLLVLAILFLISGSNKIYAESECQVCKAKKDPKVTTRASIRPKIKIERAIEMVKQYALKEGYSLEEYFILNTNYDYLTREWSIFFQGNISAPGNHFGINLNEKTGAFELFQGE